MTLDIVLYLAFAGGFLAGRLTAWRSPWVGHAATGTVGALLFLLGVSLGSLPGSALAQEVPLAVAFALSTLGLTVLVSWFLVRRPVRTDPAPATVRASLLTPLAFVVALLAGVGVGRYVGSGPASLTEYVLYVLLALVGFDLTLDRTRLRSAWIPISSAVAGGFAVGLAFVALRLVPPAAALSTAAAFGWYSLAGPLVGARLGPALGLFAFLSNFLRENVTMLTAPWAGRRVGGSGLAAMGGATSMDTTLYFIARYGGRDSATVALATGIVLTTLAGLLVPVLLSLP